MKKLNKYILIGITSLILICPFLIPITKAQEWTFDGVDTTNIPWFSVYPSEEYVFSATMSPGTLGIVEIVSGNITDPGSGNGTVVWGNMYEWNIISGEKTLQVTNFFICYWNESIGYMSTGPGFLIPVENDGKVSSRILNNVTTSLAPMLASLGLDAYQVYPSLYSIAFWNTTNDEYFHLNYTDDGILSQWESDIPSGPGNLTLYSQPAQLTPVFSFTGEGDTLIVNSTDFKIETTITDADNNNDGVTDTDYLFRILNGSTWTSWAAPVSLLDWDLGSVAAGNYTITMEVKNMYGVTQEQVTFEYKPPEVDGDGDGDGDGIISGYPIFLISMVAILGISIVIYRYRKKLRI